VLIFKTPDDSPEPVELLGVGALPGGGQGGVPVEQAALRMQELQEHGEDDQVKLDEAGNEIPLTGKKLETAAREWAESVGLEVAEVSEKKWSVAQEKAGVTAERPPLDELSKQAYERTFGGLEAVNTNPEELVLGGPTAGEPSTPEPPEELVESTDSAPLPVGAEKQPEEEGGS
jgi:hypothetical protein